MTTPAWIAADWGTSNLRVWAMGPGNEVLEHRKSAQGMGVLDRDQFEDALTSLCGGWLETPQTVVACGMVGSRQGWVEAPYARTPCKAPPPPLIPAPCNTPGLSVHIVPGVAQGAPADVMRGEETQIAGFLHTHPEWDGILCLPGTHTKWVHVSAGEIVSFRTFMTGELFGLLSTQSVLRHSVAEGWDEAAFAEAVSDALSRPESLAARLFSLRAQQLLDGTSPGILRAHLSGTLLGIELAAARPYWLGQNVALVGAEDVSRPYAAALGLQGITPVQADGDAMVLAGLIKAKETCL